MSRLRRSWLLGREGFTCLPIKLFRDRDSLRYRYVQCVTTAMKSTQSQCCVDIWMCYEVLKCAMDSRLEI